eukprot:g1664.t1
MRGLERVDSVELASSSPKSTRTRPKGLVIKSFASSPSTAGEDDVPSLPLSSSSTTSPRRKRMSSVKRYKSSPTSSSLTSRRKKGEGFRFLSPSAPTPKSPAKHLGGRRGRHRRTSIFGLPGLPGLTPRRKKPPLAQVREKMYLFEVNDELLENSKLDPVRSSYMSRPLDFFLGTNSGLCIAIMIIWIFTVWIGAFFFWLFGGSDTFDTTLSIDGSNFWDGLWASYILFIDIGTQTGLHTGDDWRVVLVAVAISLVGFVFLLIVLGVAVDAIREGMVYYEKIHEGIVENDHTVILGWNDKVLFLVEEIAQMMNSTRRTAARETIVILSPVDPIEVIQDLGTAFGSMSGEDQFSFKYDALFQRYYLHGVRIRFMKGSRNDPFDLDKISIMSARHVVVLANPTKMPLEADQDVVRTIMGIKVVDHEKTNFESDEEEEFDDEDDDPIEYAEKEDEGTDDGASKSTDDTTSATSASNQDILFYADNLRGKSDKNASSPRFTVELRLDQNVSVARRLGGEFFHCLVPRVMINKMFALSCVAPVLGRTLRNLFMFDNASEIYELRMWEDPWKRFVGANPIHFTDALTDCIALVVCRACTTVGGNVNNFVAESPSVGLRRTISAAPGVASHKVKFVRPFNIRALRESDSIMVVSQDLASIETQARNLSLGNIFPPEDGGGSKRGAEMLAKDARISTKVMRMDNYNWEAHTRCFVIMGWATDLFDLIRTLGKSATHILPGEDVMNVHVHLLGGPRRKNFRRMFWEHFVSAKNVKELPDGRLEVDVCTRVLSESGKVIRRHGIKVFHHVGRPARACYLPTLPLRHADAILILSDDDNESALASDSQCLTNLFLTAAICNGEKLNAEDDVVDDSDDEFDDANDGDSVHDSGVGGGMVPKLRVHMTMSNLLGNSAPDVLDDDDDVPPPPVMSVRASGVKGVAKKTNILCEILSPNTPKMVRVIDNPFTNRTTTTSDDVTNVSTKSDRRDDCGAREAYVTYFCTHALETSVVAYNCYNSAVAKLMEALTTALCSPDDVGFTNVVRLSCVRIGDVLKKDAFASKKEELLLSFNDLQKIMRDWDSRTLLAWQRDGNESLRGFDNPHILTGFALNPPDKTTRVAFRPSDVLVYL